MNKEQLREALQRRDLKMRGYWKSVDDGFQEGYPIEWDEPILHIFSLREQEILEALEKKAVEVDYGGFEQAVLLSDIQSLLKK